MYYQNFDSRVTLAYGVIIEGWPLPKFCCPSDVGSFTEVQLLYESWKSGATRFRKLSDSEFKAWLDRYSAGKMQGEVIADGDKGSAHAISSAEDVVVSGVEDATNNTGACIGS
jgi:hypothetical protein